MGRLTAYLEPYTPAPADLLALGAGLVLFAALAAIGNAVIRRPRLAPADALAGIGVISALLALLPWLFTVNLRWLCGLLGLVALMAAWWRRRTLVRPELWQVGLLFLPALVVACSVPLDEWDSFSHWGPNAAWLWRHDTLPTPGLPLPPSSHPEYPYVFPFLLYALGLIRGAWVDNAGAIVNALLLVPAAGALAAASAAFDARRLEARPWRYAAWGALLALPLMPWIMRSTAMAAYADTLVAVSTMLALIALWRWLESCRGTRKASGFTVALMLVALAGAKESGWLSVIVVALSGLLLALRDPLLRRWSVAGGLIVLMVPALVAAALWQAWVDWLPASFQPAAPIHWQWQALPALLGAAGDEIADHGLFYSVAFVAVVLGLQGWWRPRGALDRFRALVALAVLGHHVTILMAYLGGGFQPEELARAASFYRYSTQVGLLAVASVASFLAEGFGTGLSRRHRAVLPAALIALTLAAAPLLHRDRTPREDFLLALGKELAARLPADSRVGLAGWRCDPYAFHLLRYALYRPGDASQGLVLERAQWGEPGGRAVRPGEPDYLLRVGGACLQPPRGADMLLYRRQPDGWRLMEEWRIANE